MTAPRTQFEIPAAGQIEAAMDNMPDDVTISACIHELDVSGKSEGDISLRRGYILGLSTARVMIMTGGWTKETMLAGIDNPSGEG